MAKGKSTPIRTVRKAAPVRRKKRPALNFWRKAQRLAARIPWPAWALVAAAAVSLVLVEAAVVEVIHRMASDPITAIIFAASAALASLGVVFGPAAARMIRSHGQKAFAWKVVAACFVLAVWNLSTVLANAQAQMTADAVRAAPTFNQDQARLTTLNARIDALADEASYADQETRANYVAERDQLAQRLDGANPRPVLFAWENDGWIFWLKAGLFHALVAGFSTAFAMQMANKRRASKSSGRRGKVTADSDSNVLAVQF